jgi:hypothetical protein
MASLDDQNMALDGLGYVSLVATTFALEYLLLVLLDKHPVTIAAFRARSLSRHSTRSRVRWLDHSLWLFRRCLSLHVVFWVLFEQLRVFHS